MIASVPVNLSQYTLTRPERMAMSIQTNPMRRDNPQSGHRDVTQVAQVAQD